MRRNFLFLNSLLTSLLALFAVNTHGSTTESAPIEEHMIVTGSRIHQPAPTDVLIFNRADIERSGAVTLTALVRDLPYGNAGTMDEQNTQGFAPASAAVDLRGLGVNRTLVLVNGRRMPHFPFARNGAESFVDLNMIPLASVERIEILKDGASAIYGADAIAGVVNIITRGSDAGRKISGRYSASSEGDAEEAYISIVGSAQMGRSELGVALDYLNRDPVWARDRDLTASANGPIDDRSVVGNPGTYITSAGPVPDSACSPADLSGPFCSYDFADDVTLVPESERVGISAEYDFTVSDRVGLFAHFAYSQSDSERDLAAAPNAYPVAATNPNNIFGEDVLALYRTNELGPRRDTFETEAFNLTFGINGTINQWFWELAAGTAEIDSEIRGVLGYALAADVQAAIDTGTLNVFGPSPTLDPAALRYETARDGESQLDQVDFRLTGTVAELPHGPLGVAFGMEYRAEEFSDQFDSATASGAVIGVGGVSAEGDRDVWASYIELSVPVWATVDLQIAGRYDNYDDFGSTVNPKLALRWQASEDLTVTASVSEGFKAPALQELYAGQIIGFDSVFDTTNCEAARAANDALGVSQYCDNVAEVMFATSGNADLDPEESENASLGVVWTPMDDWRVGLTYWTLDNEDAVASDPQFYINNEQQFPSNVIRNGGGDISMVLSPFQNLAEQSLWGVDGQVDGQFSLDSAGTLDFSLALTHLGEFEQQAFAGAVREDIAGKNGYAEWRAHSRLAWQRADYQVSVNVNFTDGYERPDPDDEVGSWTTIDAQLNWAPELLRGGAITVGLDNAFDREPPEDPFLRGWPFYNRALHDPRGRFWYLSYSHDL